MGTHLFCRPPDLPQKKETSIKSPTKRIPPTIPRASATLLFLFCGDAADVGVPAADAPVEDIGKWDEGVEEVVVAANKSGL
jgi:hypothetical protein